MGDQLRIPAAVVFFWFFSCSRFDFFCGLFLLAKPITSELSKGPSVEQDFAKAGANPDPDEPDDVDPIHVSFLQRLPWYGHDERCSRIPMVHNH